VHSAHLFFRCLWVYKDNVVKVGVERGNIFSGENFEREF